MGVRKLKSGWLAAYAVETLYSFCSCRYDMILKGKGLRKSVADSSSKVSILEPGKPRGPEEVLRLLETSVVHRDGEYINYFSYCEGEGSSC